jgi:hypothetical protein
VELRRYDYYDYVRTVHIDVKGYDEGCLEHTVGKLTIETVRWQDAQLDGVSLEDVCDADSAGLADIHRILAGPDDPQELREDLGIQAVTSEVLFVFRVLLHPDLPDRCAILDAAFRATTTDDSLVVMWHGAPHNTRFTERELADLGFAKIAGEELVYRDQHYVTSFEKEHPSGQDVEFLATEEHARWISDMGSERQ